MAKKIDERIDMTTGMSDLRRLRGKTIAQLQAERAKAAKGPSAEAGQRLVCAIAFAYGRAWRKENPKAPFAKGKFDAEFNLFAAQHWTPVDMPGDGSMKQYRSRYGAFCDAGLLDWDATDLVAKVIGVRGGMNLSDRASLMRSLTMDKGKPLAAAPHDKVVQATMFPTGEGTVETDGMTAIKGLINSAVNVANNSKVIATLASDSILAAVVRPILDAALTQSNSWAQNRNAKQKADLLAKVQSARAALAKLDADDKPRRSRRDLN